LTEIYLSSLVDQIGRQAYMIFILAAEGEFFKTVMP